MVAFVGGEKQIGQV
jgi:hypothetical protein